MKIIFTNQSFQSLEELSIFLIDVQMVPKRKVKEIIRSLLNKTNSLVQNPHKGQLEEYLKHLSLGHRRIIEGYVKVIYRVDGDKIYITDFFDTRQDPKKMKG